MNTYQIELWRECNNNCTFCFLGIENRRTSDDHKISILKKTYESICSLDYNEYNCISYIGGDFFQGQLDNILIYNEFIKLMKKTAELLNKKKINSVWISVTLTIGDQKQLYNILDIFKNCEYNTANPSNGLWLCTSWDSFGRFHTKESQENWEFHMKNIKKIYPNIKFNTTIILTQNFINKCLNKQFDFYKFSQEFSTEFYFKIPGIGAGTTKKFFDILEGISKKDINSNEKRKLKKEQYQLFFNNEYFPTRSSFLSFLYLVATKYPIIYDKLYNINYRANSLINARENKEIQHIHRYKNSRQESDLYTEELGPNEKCGHMYEYAMYSNNDSCMICDRIKVWQSIYNEEIEYNYCKKDLKGKMKKW